MYTDLAGRDGQSAVATILYSMSDIDHDGTWVRNTYTILPIANEFLRNSVICGGVPCWILLGNVEGRFYCSYLEKTIIP